MPLGGRHPVDAGQEIASHLDDAGKLLYARLIPTDPQLQPGALTFVQVPNWVDTSDQRVAVVDFSAFGEPTYAAFLPAVLSLSDLQAAADSHHVNSWDVYLDGSSTPVVHPGGRVCSGSVLKFRPIGSAPIWGVPLNTHLDNPDFACAILPDECFEQEACSWLACRVRATHLVPCPATDPGVARTTVAQRSHRASSQVWFVEPLNRSFAESLTHSGWKPLESLLRCRVRRRPLLVVLRQVADVPVFVDGRQAGLGVFMQILPAGETFPERFAADLPVKLPAGFVLRVDSDLTCPPHGIISAGGVLTVSIVPACRVETAFRHARAGGRGHSACEGCGF